MQPKEALEAPCAWYNGALQDVAGASEEVWVR